VEVFTQEFIVRSCTVLICLLFSFSILADEKGKSPHQPSVFEVIPLNSPVHGSAAKFSLKLPTGFEVDKIQVKLKDAKDLFDRKKPKFENVQVSNNIFSVSVSRLPPGFYRLYVKVWDKKNKGEHDFKTKFHDYVRFVIDESLQVPIPDPIKNNATIAGIDSDNDGIRDDVQRWINETYVNEPKTKLAMKQYAVSYQLELTTVDSKEQSIQATNKANEADQCLKGLIGLDPAIDARDSLIGRYLNTKVRLIAEKKADLNFHGQGGVAPDNQLALCQFEVE
jgi:hypothetical protein